MTSFKIEVQEVLSRICPVEANSREEAIHRVKQLYDDGEISLGQMILLMYSLTC